jgi:micrococcal nuclease
VWDGDTCRLDVDLGFHTWTLNQPFRLHGIDAHELGDETGRAARDYARALMPVGAELIAITYRDKREKYGRMLAELYQPEDLVTSINQKLIDAGHAVAYDGGAR